MKKLVRLFLGMGVCGAFCLAAERPLPNPPPGFKKEPDSPSSVAMRQSAVADNVRAAKPDDLRPNCGGDPNIHFEYGWTASPGGYQVLELIARSPEEPASQKMGVRSEPASKKTYKGGVLVWRKDTVLMVGVNDPKCKEIISYTGIWTGYADGKMIGIGVHGSVANAA
jgi:hypothetical protein